MGIKPGTEDISGNGKYPDFACKLLNHVNIFSCFCNFTFFEEFLSFCQQTCLDTPFPNSPLVKFTKISAVMGVFIELGLPGGLAGWQAGVARVLGPAACASFVVTPGPQPAN